MTTVTISGSSYEVYESAANATIYLNGDYRYSTIWSALSADNKSRALVASTRFLDSLRWQGSKTSDSQALEWPRTDVINKYSVAISSSTVPTDFLAAYYIMAALIASSPEILDNPGAAGNVKAVNAGLSAVKFFKPTGVGSPIPLQLKNFIGHYLAIRSVTPTDDLVSGGNEGESAFDDDYGFNVVGGS